ncbi:cytochrome c oxidase subunit 3 [Mucilaginibacter sp.]|jgi:cytochrome c oxidase subunit 3|uniref:cytochrome c oxidase subunit 3 n=1 Tax=Mucilaginibacter sp. TaxID=1882438 RepID=UPI002C60F379|nr:cytochrome c oxidase subunit 3 [Mucilaginibacter sp.]HTI59770.1 cytochrome c oxidase subunit 3 [Mucilaginibacter sp.]
MMAQITKENDRQNLGAKKFVLWLFVFASFMIFAALTSGFIVYAGGNGHALNVQMPHVFIYSTIVIATSSITLILASRAAKHSQPGKQRLFIWITMALGITFFILQVYGWYVLTYKMGIYFVNPNATRSFVYVLTGTHLVHIIAGLGFLVAAILGSSRGKPQSINLFRMDLASIFWHFIDIIWIYLYVFLLLNQN